MNNDKVNLFTSISSGDINNSLLLTTKYILLNDNFEILENTLIEVSSYIGTFINLYDIKKLLDIYTSIKNFIENDKIIIKEIYILIAKLCIICDIYNKNSISRCGTMSIKNLKQKISYIFQKEDFKLSSNGIMKFDGVLPPNDDENFKISLKIITILIKTIKSTDDISLDFSDELNNISTKLKNIIDYILRANYKFETKFFSQDNDSAWFLWGIFSILYKEEFLSDAFWLYNYNFKKTFKKKRQGILISMGCAVIYSHKKDISIGWNKNELNVLNKIDDIALKLYNEIRQKITKENPDAFQEDKRVNENDGLDVISGYIPIFNENYGNISKDTRDIRETHSTKSIIC